MLITSYKRWQSLLAAVVNPYLFGEAEAVGFVALIAASCKGFFLCSFPDISPIDAFITRLFPAPFSLVPELYFWRRHSGSSLGVSTDLFFRAMSENSWIFLAKILIRSWLLISFWSQCQGFRRVDNHAARRFEAIIGVTPVGKRIMFVHYKSFIWSIKCCSDLCSSTPVLLKLHFKYPCSSNFTFFKKTLNSFMIILFLSLGISLVRTLASIFLFFDNKFIHE